MTNIEVVGILIGMIREYMTYFIPVIAVLSGVNYVVSLLFSVTLRASTRGGRQ